VWLFSASAWTIRIENALCCLKEALAVCGGWFFGAPLRAANSCQPPCDCRKEKGGVQFKVSVNGQLDGETNGSPVISPPAAHFLTGEIMTDLKPKKGASEYRTIATFLTKWLQYFSIEESSFTKQKQVQPQSKWQLYFNHLSPAISRRIFDYCGPEASQQKEMWRQICVLVKHYQKISPVVEKYQEPSTVLKKRQTKTNKEKAADLVLAIESMTKELRDSFIIVHNRHYGMGVGISKKEKALALRAAHHDWSDEKVAKEAGFAHPQALYRDEDYKALNEALKELTKKKVILPPRGTKDQETGELEAW
jgi:hypothetical protein